MDVAALKLRVGKCTSLARKIHVSNSLLSKIKLFALKCIIIMKLESRWLFEIVNLKYDLIFLSKR